MNTHLKKSQMIANVAMMAMEGAADLDQRIGILVNVTCTIHKDRQTDRSIQGRSILRVAKSEE